MIDGLLMSIGTGPMYYILFFGALAFSLIAQAMVSGTFNKYSNVSNARLLTGAQAADRVLRANGVRGVRIERVSGHLTDHFSPNENVIRLSDQVYGSTSIGALGVAAHEAGHACQYAQSYYPITLRNAVLPAFRIGQSLALPLAFLGLFLQMFNLVLIGIVLFSAVLIFQLITLPVEFNASSRALQALEDGGILSDSELVGARKVLRAAGMTYVAGAAMAAVQLLRLVLMAQSSRRRN